MKRKKAEKSEPAYLDSTQKYLPALQGSKNPLNARTPPVDTEPKEQWFQQKYWNLTLTTCPERLAFHEKLLRYVKWSCSNNHIVLTRLFTFIALER